jgi:hypothetical protein
VIELMSYLKEAGIPQNELMSYLKEVGIQQNELMSYLKEVWGLTFRINELFSFAGLR